MERGKKRVVTMKCVAFKGGEVDVNKGKNTTKNETTVRKINSHPQYSFKSSCHVLSLFLIFVSV